MKHSDLYVWCIQWEDACSADSWASDVDTNLALIMTTGVLLKETDDVVQMCLNVDTSNDAISCAINIPKVNIVKRKRLCRLTDLKTNKKTTQ
jgi:hypothetical protein